jgi:peroxiredoxin
MKRTVVLKGGGLVFVLLALLLLPVMDAPGESPSRPLRIGDVLPSLSFSDSLTSAERSYLGVGQRKAVSIQNIQAHVIVLYLLNSHCPICANSVSGFREVFERIEENPELKKRTRIVGIGAGDTPVEVSTFREHHAIPYPLIPDPEYHLHKLLKQPNVPFILVARKDSKGRFIVVRLHSGADFSAETLVDELSTILIPGSEKPGKD